MPQVESATAKAEGAKISDAPKGSTKAEGKATEGAKTEAK
jgi:hypothetical protein